MRFCVAQAIPIVPVQEEAIMEQGMKTNTALTDIISAAISLPGVKVNREAFLREQFKSKPEELI